MLKRVGTIAAIVVVALFLGFVVIAVAEPGAAGSIAGAVKDALLLLVGALVSLAIGLGLIRLGSLANLSPITIIGGLCIAGTVVFTFAALLQFWSAITEGAGVLGL